MGRKVGPGLKSTGSASQTLASICTHPFPTMPLCEGRTWAWNTKVLSDDGHQPMCAVRNGLLVPTPGHDSHQDRGLVMCPLPREARP